MYKCRRTLPHHSKKLATKPQTDLRLIGFFLATQYWCSRFSRFRDGPLEKLWGRGGEFRVAGIFFRYQIPCMNFSDRSMNIL